MLRAFHPNSHDCYEGFGGGNIARQLLDRSQSGLGDFLIGKAEVEFDGRTLSAVS